MVLSLAERLEFFGPPPEIVKSALLAADIERYHLPPNLAKRSDTRAARFVAKHGDVSVELDALPADVLRGRIRTEVECRTDLDALAETRRIEERERGKLEEWLQTARRRAANVR